MIDNKTIYTKKILLNSLFIDNDYTPSNAKALMEDLHYNTEKFGSVVIESSDLTDAETIYIILSKKYFAQCLEENICRAIPI